MKTPLSHIITSILLSCIFIFAGTGFNVISYCCNTCAEAGIEKVAEMSCDCIHHHHHHTNKTEHHLHPASENICMQDFQKGCDLNRLTVDVPSLQLNQDHLVDYSLLYIDLSSLLTDFVTNIETVENETNIEHNSHHFIPLTGRRILSENSILLIWFINLNFVNRQIYNCIFVLFPFFLFKLLTSNSENEKTTHINILCFN